MAAVLSQGSVTFTESLTENIGYAKEFWKAIDGNFDKKSSLFVAGLDHRLHTASQGNRTTSGKTDDNIKNGDEEAGLVNNRKEANRRLKVEEEEYVQNALNHRKEQQDLMKKRKDERLAKENLRESGKQTFMEELSSLDVDDDKKFLEDEVLQTMKDIDDFERMVKITNERKKEK